MTFHRVRYKSNTAVPHVEQGLLTLTGHLISPLWYLQTFLATKKKRHDGNGLETHVLQRTTNNHKTLLNDKVVHHLQGVCNYQCNGHHSRPLLGLVVHLIGKHNKRMVFVGGLHVCTEEPTPYFYILGVTVFSSICRTELNNILLNLLKMSEEKSLLISVFIVLFSINMAYWLNFIYF